MYVCTHTACMHTCTYTHTYMYVHICTCMYVTIWCLPLSVSLNCDIGYLD